MLVYKDFINNWHTSIKRLKIPRRFDTVETSGYVSTWFLSDKFIYI